MEILILFIDAIAQLMVLLVIVSVILSYFINPYHPVRRSIDSVVEPMLAPIRRVVPLLGMIDLSPLVLILLIQILRRVIIGILLSI